MFETIIPLTRSVTPVVTDGVTENVTEGEAAVLRLIVEDPAMTQTIMAMRLSVSRKTVAERLTVLKEKGLVHREGSDRSGRWIVLT